MQTANYTFGPVEMGGGYLPRTIIPGRLLQSALDYVAINSAWFASHPGNPNLIVAGTDDDLWQNHPVRHVSDDARLCQELAVNSRRSCQDGQRFDRQHSVRTIDGLRSVGSQIDRRTGKHLRR